VRCQLSVCEFKLNDKPRDILVLLADLVGESFQTVESAGIAFRTLFRFGDAFALEFPKRFRIRLIVFQRSLLSEGGFPEEAKKSAAVCLQRPHLRERDFIR
jgi:hypothetical protein